MRSLVVQNTYKEIELALFENESCIEKIAEDKLYASKHFIVLLDTLLQKNNTQLLDLSFCTVNQGPSPFTTLRTVITSMNSMHCAVGIPLIGIDGLEAFFTEYQSSLKSNSLIILNAFNKDVYFCFKRSDKALFKGYKKIDALLWDIREQLPYHQISFLGNAVALYSDIIKDVFDIQYVHFIDPMPDTCSIEQLGRMGYERWKLRDGLCSALAPLYLKQHAVYDDTERFRNLRL